MAMSLPEVAMRSASLGALVLLLVIAVDASAQGYRPGSLDLVDQGPAYLLGFSPSAPRVFEQEREMDLQALNTYAGKRRVAGPLPVERTDRWTLYGGLGLVNFHKQLDPGGEDVKFSWRRSGPGLGGRIHLGMHRRF